MSIIYDGTLFGDTFGSLGRHARAGSQKLSADSVVGDADALRGHAAGGNDIVCGILEAVGDAFTITDHGRGGDDLVSIDSAAGRTTYAYGDAYWIYGHGRGGDDHVIASAAYGVSQIVGDANLLTDHARGGDDLMTGGAPSGQFEDRSAMYGDAGEMTGFARGGNDVLLADGDSQLAGDAWTLRDHTRGGNDVLKGGSVEDDGKANLLIGDGYELLDYARGGDDVLISAVATNDYMWGDAAFVDPHAKTGADRFVIVQDSGHDQIIDFEPGKDHIDLSDFGFHGFSQVASLLQTTPDGVLISFDTQNDVLVHDVSHLSARDFLFA